MNYQRFPKELTLISNRYLEFFNYNNDAIVEYNLANSENNDLRIIFIDDNQRALRLLLVN